MGLDSVLVITDQIDDNLLLASRNLANVLVVEPRHADPLSLVHFKKVLVTKGAIEQLKEMLRMSAASKPSRRRSSTEPSGPGAGRADRLREGTMVAEKHNQVLFKVLRDATKPEIKAAVELMFKVEVDIGADAVQQGQGQELRPLHRPPRPRQEGVRVR